MGCVCSQLSCGPKHSIPRMRIFVVLAGCSFLLLGSQSCSVTLRPLLVFCSNDKIDLLL